jgi:hypothetical protein
MLCKACTDRGLVCSAKIRIFNNMLYVRNIYCDVLPKSLKAGRSEAALFTRQRNWLEAFPLQRN